MAFPTSPRNRSDRVRTRNTSICRKGFIPSRPQAGAAWEGQVSERVGLLHTLKGRTPLNYSGAMCTPPAFNFEREKNKIGRVGPVLAPSIQIRAALTLVPRLYFRPVSITYSFFFLSFAPGDALTLIFKYPHPRRPLSDWIRRLYLFENNLKSWTSESGDSAQHFTILLLMLCVTFQEHKFTITFFKFTWCLNRRCDCAVWNSAKSHYPFKNRDCLGLIIHPRNECQT